MKKILGLCLVLALTALASCSNDYEEGAADSAAVDATVDAGANMGDAIDAAGEATVDGGAAVIDAAGNAGSAVVDVAGSAVDATVEVGNDIAEGIDAMVTTDAEVENGVGEDPIEDDEENMIDPSMNDDLPEDTEDDMMNR